MKTKKKLHSKHLPEEFASLRIVQISDIHSGSFTRTSPIEEAIEKGVPTGKPNSIIEDNEIDLQFVGLYEYKDGKADLNIEKAKAIHLDKFRSARSPKLQKLDVDFMKAVEANDEVKKAEIIAAKQALRDVTLTPLPDDLAGIKATWPDILK